MAAFVKTKGVQLKVKFNKHPGTKISDKTIVADVTPRTCLFYLKYKRDIISPFKEYHVICYNYTIMCREED